MFSFTASLVSSRRRLTLVGLFGGLALALLPAASAHATGLINTAACDNATLTQPFLPWGDSNYYKLVPGGDFEGSLAGWTLSGGATRVSGGEQLDAMGSAGGSAIYLPAGGSIQSPFTCVDFAYPTLRFFALNKSLLSTVAVSIVYREPLLGSLAVPLGVSALSPQWAPSAPVLTLSEVQGVVSGLLTGSNPQVAVRFTALTGSSEIDDVFIDPERFR